MYPAEIYTRSCNHPFLGYLATIIQAGLRSELSIIKSIAVLLWQWLRYVRILEELGMHALPIYFALIRNTHKLYKLTVLVSSYLNVL